MLVFETALAAALILFGGGFLASRGRLGAAVRPRAERVLGAAMLAAGCVLAGAASALTLPWLALGSAGLAAAGATLLLASLHRLLPPALLVLGAVLGGAWWVQTPTEPEPVAARGQRERAAALAAKLGGRTAGERVAALILAPSGSGGGGGSAPGDEALLRLAEAEDVDLAVLASGSVPPLLQRLAAAAEMPLFLLPEEAPGPLVFEPRPYVTLVLAPVGAEASPAGLRARLEPLLRGATARFRLLVLRGASGLLDEAGRPAPEWSELARSLRFDLVAAAAPPDSESLGLEAEGTTWVLLGRGRTGGRAAVRVEADPFSLAIRPVEALEEAGLLAGLGRDLRRRMAGDPRFPMGVFLLFLAPWGLLASVAGVRARRAPEG